MPLDFSTRANLTERMDRQDADPEQFRRTLDQFRHMNRLVSRYQYLFTHFILADMLRDVTAEYRLLDIGSGGCDIPAWIDDRCRQQGIRVAITCVDADPRAIAFAQEHFGARPTMRILQLSVADLERLDGPFDYLIANHFLHHLADEDLPATLARIDRQTRRLFVLNDLYRSRVAYSFFSILAPLFFRDSFICEDGMLSIRRGFRRHEFEHLAGRIPSTTQIEVGTIFPARLYMVGRK